MKYKYLLIIFCLLTLSVVQAQITVNIDDLKMHIGDSITVCTKIYGGIYLDNSAKKITLLNAGAAYPNSPLTLLIYANTRKQFKQAPEILYKNKDVCISGKLILYNEKPEIIIYDLRQIK